MCSRVWFVTDRRISQEYPQLQILRALKERCVDEDVEFRSLLMDMIVLTISEGQLGKYQPINQSSMFVNCVKLFKMYNLDYFKSVGPPAISLVVMVGGHCLGFSC